jgi:hypothetical protein
VYALRIYYVPTATAKTTITATTATTTTVVMARTAVIT